MRIFFPRPTDSRRREEKREMFEIIKDGSWVVLEDGVFVADFNTKAEAESYVLSIKGHR